MDGVGQQGAGSDREAVVSACRRIGVWAYRRTAEDSHTEVTEVRKGHECLKGFRTEEKLDFARFGARAYMLCALRVDLLYADTLLPIFSLGLACFIFWRFVIWAR